MPAPAPLKPRGNRRVEAHFVGLKGPRQERIGASHEVETVGSNPIPSIVQKTSLRTKGGVVAEKEATKPLRSLRCESRALLFYTLIFRPENLSIGGRGNFRRTQP